MSFFPLIRFCVLLFGLVACSSGDLLADGRGTRLISFPDLHSSVLFEERGFVSSESRVVFVLFGGLGGRADTHSIVRTGPYFVNGLRKRGRKLYNEKIDPQTSGLSSIYDGLAVEHPYYFPANGEARLELFERYRSLESQLSWAAEMVRVIQEQIQKNVQSGGHQKKLVLVGRSFGGALLMEALHRYLRGSKTEAYLADVSAIVWYGLGSPAMGNLWEQRKSEILADRSGQMTRDARVTNAYLSVFQEMSWDKKGMVRMADDAQLPIPRVRKVLGLRDEFLTRAEQVQVIQSFSTRHPAVEVEWVAMDTSHDAGRAVQYQGMDGQNVKTRSMVRLMDVLDRLVEDLENDRYNPGPRQASWGMDPSNVPLGRCEQILLRGDQQG